MQKEIKAALAAANKKGCRNEGDREEYELIVAQLTDALVHAERLDELADVWERAQRIAAAQNELRAAESG